VVNEVAYRTGEAASHTTYGSRPVTLVDLLDRLLSGGVVIQGEITLAAADIDLVELGLGIVVASIDKMRQ
jgi:hypothetical protein